MIACLQSAPNRSFPSADSSPSYVLGVIDGCAGVLRAGERGLERAPQAVERLDDGEVSAVRRRVRELQHARLASARPRQLQLEHARDHLRGGQNPKESEHEADGRKLHKCNRTDQPLQVQARAPASSRPGRGGSGSGRAGAGRGRRKRARRAARGAAPSRGTPGTSCSRHARSHPKAVPALRRVNARRKILRVLGTVRAAT